MRISHLFLALLLFTAPLSLRAADMNEIPRSDMPKSEVQSVEEPDAPDEDEMKELDLPPPIPADVAKPQPVPVPVQPVVNPATTGPAPVKISPEPSLQEGDTNYDRVILQGLNKVTARAQEIDAPIGSVVRFGTVEIVAHSCWKAAPDERPENAALLEISEVKQGEAPTQIFKGWMFASTPGLSALEHPFYDISVVKCQKATPAPVPAPAASAPVKAPKKKTK